MTVTLHLKPEVEASLLERAQASGMGLEDYLLTVVEEAVLCAHPPIELETRVDAVRRMLEFGDRHHLSLGEPITRSLMHEGLRF